MVRVAVYVHAWSVVAETPMGYWISGIWVHPRKWVAKAGKKRYVYPTVAEAVQSFKARKARQIAILAARLEEARAAQAVDPDRYVPCRLHGVLSSTTTQPVTTTVG